MARCASIERKLPVSPKTPDNKLTERPITRYFAQRKRRCAEGDSKNVDVICKKLRKDVIVTPRRTVPVKSKRLSLPVQSAPSLFSSTTDSTMGIFSQLPSLVQEAFFSNADIRALMGLAQTSADMGHAILVFLVSSAGRRRLARDVSSMSAEDIKTPDDVFFLYGQLLKCASFTKENRMCWLDRFYKAHNANVKDMDGWGRLFHSMTSGWSLKERYGLLRQSLLMNDNLLGDALKKVVASSPGVHKADELKVRTLLRALLLDHLENDLERAFWLSLILKLVPKKSMKANLLTILYAPVSVDDNGHEMVDRSSLVTMAVSSRGDASARVFPLADAISWLLRTPDLGQADLLYSHTDVFNLIEEVTTYPEPWSFDNFMAFLLRQPRLIPIAVTTRMEHMYGDDCGNIIIGIKTLAYRWGEDLRTTLYETLLNTFKPLNGFQQRRVFHSVAQAHAKAVADAIQESIGIEVIGGAFDRDLSDELKSYSELINLLTELVEIA